MNRGSYRGWPPGSQKPSIARGLYSGRGIRALGSGRSLRLHFFVLLVLFLRGAGELLLLGHSAAASRRVPPPRTRTPFDVPFASP